LLDLIHEGVFAALNFFGGDVVCAAWVCAAASSLVARASSVPEMAYVEDASKRRRMSVISLRWLQEYRPDDRYCFRGGFCDFIGY
jgi:hypothetical protein